jgi:hypothetical protein
VTYAGNTAQFKPDANLAGNTWYKSTISSKATDLAGNALVVPPAAGGLPNPWSWQTGATADTTAPIMFTVGAADGTIGLPINRSSTVTFSEVMDQATLISASPSTAAGTTFTVCATATQGGACVTPVAGVVTYAVRTATFKPDANLVVNTWYKSTITAGAKDLAGNALLVPPAAGGLANPWSWQTGAAADTTPPLISLESPVDLGTAVPVNSTVNATFNEAMNQATITFTLQTSGPPLGASLPGTVTYDPLTNIATFTPNALLATSTIYTATVTGKDLAGNALVVPGVVSIVAPINKPNPWTFTTAAIPPVALAVNLGTAATYGIAAGAGMTSTGVTVVNGNVALSPLGTCTDATGTPANCMVEAKPASALGLTVNGSIRFPTDSDAGATAAAVKTDLTAAWTEGFNKVDTFAPGFLVGQLASKTLLPGVYNEANLGLSAAGVSTFDAQNNPNAIFIIKVGTIGGAGDFTDSGTLLLPSQIVLANQAQARNIWFIVGRDITIGSGTTWFGNILAGRTATLNDGSTVLGRVLAGAQTSGAITLTGAASPSVTTITVP